MSRRVVDSDDDDDDNADAGPVPGASKIKRSNPALQVIEDSEDEDGTTNGAPQQKKQRVSVRFSAGEKGKGRAVSDDGDDAGMANGDEEDVQDEEEEEEEYLDENDEISGAQSGGASFKKKANGPGGGQKTTFSWEEEYSRSWDALTEDSSGSLSGAVAAFLSSSKGRRRILRDTASIQRGIIRHLYLILDLSEAMTDKDMRPSRLEVTLKYAQEFVGEFFDQNPISQLAIIGTKDGMAERISSLGGNPVEHVKMLQNKRKLAASGEPSLQNSLNMARSGLAHLPTHGSREVVVIFGSLTTCDPGNVHDTIEALVKDRVRVNIIGLAAELSVCREIAKKTRGTFNVCLNEDHFKDLLFEHILPPASLKPSGQTLSTPSSSSSQSDLMLMGFPTLLSHSQYPTLCSCHSKLYRSKGYICPRCSSKLCEVPTECGICKLTIVASPHLARSYRHLFPVGNWQAVNSGRTEDWPEKCFGCSVPFPPFSSSSESNGATPASPAKTPANPPPYTTTTAPVKNNNNNGEVVIQNKDPNAGTTAGQTSASGRYRCPKCGNMFCIDCDIFTHQLGACPGCQ